MGRVSGKSSRETAGSAVCAQRKSMRGLQDRLAEKAP